MTPKEIRSRRIALGLTVQQFAAELGIPVEHLREIEDGERKPPAESLVRKAFDSALDQRVRPFVKGKTRDCLIVEDDAAVRHLFAKRLRAEGCEVDEAADGLEAVDATAQRDYRLMLLDLKLPKLSGAEVLARVTKKPAPVPNVIVISAAGSGDVNEVAGHKSVSAILRKGFAIEKGDIIFPALAALAVSTR